jgi:hypothetical protein
MAHSRQLFRRFLILLFILTTMALIGCGAVQHKITFQDYSPQAQTKIEVGQVTNETKQTFDINIEQMLTDAFAEALRKEAMLWEGGSESKLVLTSKIIEYDKGNAFKRWLLPGWGSTVLTIQSDLKDGDKVVGCAEARRTVSFGGGYTIGAWQTIFNSVAKDVVKDLCTQIPK